MAEEISDELWEQIEPLLAPYKRTRRGGTKPIPFRDIFNAGLRRARAAGKVLGRPKVGAEIEAAIRVARQERKGIRKIARELGIGVSVVQRVVGKSEKVAQVN